MDSVVKIEYIKDILDYIQKFLFSLIIITFIMENNNVIINK